MLSSKTPTMEYNFDLPIDRQQTDSYKWDKYPEGVLPLWVADMDFECAEPIKNSLQALVDRNLIGYSRVPDALLETVLDRLANRHNWEVQAEWITWLPGMVPGLHASSMALGAGTYDIMTSSPVYRPFLEAAQRPNRRLIDVPFLWKHNRWEMDFDTMEKSITPETRLYMLCNPHNPNGRMFDASELAQLGAFCQKHNLWICADEIHCDLIIDSSKRHISIGTLSEDLANRTITLLAPSKTYNIAGLGCSMAVIPNPEIRKAFQDAIYGILPHPNAFAHQAALAAYRDSNDWLDQVLTYLRGNHAYLLSEINAITGLHMEPLEATYLAWIRIDPSLGSDFTQTLEKFGVGVQDAKVFGGNGYFRLNFATQRSLLEKAVKRIQQAVKSLLVV